MIRQSYIFSFYSITTRHLITLWTLWGPVQGATVVLTEAPSLSGYSELAVTPYFLPAVTTNVTTTVSQTAYLHCRISSLGDEAQVSWIRKKDLHVLSSGKIVFATDQRFQVIHQDKSENWTLEIRYAQMRDSGVYECQVNTNPKISKAFYLTVIDAKAEIQGPEYVKAGSTINLTCTITQPFMRGLVYWYLNSKILDYEENQVKIITDGNTSLTTSQLTILDAQPSHSGNLTCWPTLAKPSSVVINVVLDGEQPAAMQTGGASLSLWHPLMALLSFVLSIEEAFFRICPVFAFLR